MKLARGFLALFWLAAPVARADDAELQARLVDLYLATVPRHCDAIDCPWRAELEEAIDDAVRGNPARSLGWAASAIHELGGHPRGNWGWALIALVDAAFERAEEARSEAEARRDALCSGMRIALRPRLAQADRWLDLATSAEQRGLLPRTTLYLGLAVHAWGLSVRYAVPLQARCFPRDCAASLPALAFTPGDPGNPGLSLQLPDRGTLLDYDFSSQALLSPAASGILRRTHAGLASSRTQARLRQAGQALSLAGATALGSCTDPSGWIRISSLSDSLLARGAAATARRVSVLRAAVPALSVPGALGVLPPFALEPRVGDRIEERGIALRGVGLPGGAVDLRCDASHRVEAIESLALPAGTFQTARIASQLACTGTRAGAAVQESFELTAWLASELGHVRVQLRSGASSLGEWNLRCYELPETAGRCGAL